MITAYLARHWVAAALIMGLMLLAIVPVGIVGGDRAVLMVYLAGPVYMLHQVEEHWGDRFRSYVNTVVFGGVEALTTSDVLLINLPGVWGINLLALYAAHFITPGWGLAAPWLMLINGITHVVMGVVKRSYNPGLVTAALVFIPFGLVSLWLIPGSGVQQGVGLAIALVIHAAIAVHAKWRAVAAMRVGTRTVH